MLLQDEVKLLQKLDLFAGIDPGRLKILAFASERCHFDPEETLFREGDESFGALVIVSGTVDVSKSEDGVHVLKTGSDKGVAIVGQSSMMSDQPRNATVTALTEVEALRINRDCFVKLMASCPKCSAGIMDALGRKLSDEDLPKAVGAFH
ncbi:cyclic nucleotide-binding domain-containing protein [Frigidibacter sp. MR17.14]|uniref:cyclic nucleotide-binding domain-containing protein n=1 Tax=Frigidibacter sp. MR17.14 TaxID=3126509 RepID=UPI003012EB97